MKKYVPMTCVFMFVFWGCEGPSTEGRIVEYKAAPAPAYTIKIDTVTGGEVRVSPGHENYTSGEYVKLTATADSNHLFKGWTGTIQNTENPYILTVTSDMWIIPQFEAVATYTLFTDWNPIGGTITSTAGDKTTFLTGEKCLLKATPVAGYQFDGWEGDIEATGDTIYITFTKDYQVYPRFSIIPVVQTYTLTTSGTNGVIRRSPDKSSYYANETVRITAVPDSGYMFLLWTAGYTGSGCPISFDVVMNGDKTISASFIQREWTFIVYMAADNDLESAAITDFNELEAVSLAGKPVSMLVLFDRSAGYDATNGDWTDTRLFEVSQDANGNNATIISKRLECSELGLSSTTATELNMADPLVLSRLIDFAKGTYTATKYGLLIWGHGTGWRGGGIAVHDIPEPVKAIAIDEYSGQYMTLSTFGGAVEGKGLNVIGFDTCFGAELEVAYQIRNSAEYMVASAGIIPSNGWDYQRLFTSFFAMENPTASGFCDCSIAQFSAQYSGTDEASISKINLLQVGALYTAFETYSGTLAGGITNSATKTSIVHAMLAADRYSFAPPSDLYIDIDSFSRIKDTGGALRTALDAAIPASWSKRYGSARKQMGVFFVGMTEGGIPEASHPAGYVKGSSVTNKSAFVQDSVHWVANSVPSSVSLLDKLFYSGY